MFLGGDPRLRGDDKPLSKNAESLARAGALTEGVQTYDESQGNALSRRLYAFLSEGDDDFVHTLREDRGHIRVNLLAIDDHLGDTLAHVLRVLHFDFVGSTAELAGHLEAVPLGGDAGVHDEALEAGAHTDDELRGSLVGPGTGAGEPCVTAHTELLVFVTEDVLRVAIRFGFELVGNTVRIRTRRAWYSWQPG